MIQISKVLFILNAHITFNSPKVSIILIGSKYVKVILTVLIERSKL